MSKPYVIRTEDATCPECDAPITRKVWADSVSVPDEENEGGTRDITAWAGWSEECECGYTAGEPPQF